MENQTYESQVKNLETYIPILKNLITKLESSGSEGSNPRQQQLDKVKTLYELLINKDKKITPENMIKCESFLTKLKSKLNKNQSKTEELDSKNNDKDDNEGTSYRNNEKIDKDYKDKNDKISKTDRKTDFKEKNLLMEEIIKPQLHSTVHVVNKTNERKSGNTFENTSYNNPYNDRDYRKNKYYERRPYPSSSKSSEYPSLSSNKYLKNDTLSSEFSKMNVFRRLGEKIDLNNYENFTIKRDNMTSNKDDVLRSPPLSADDINELLSENEDLDNRDLNQLSKMREDLKRAVEIEDSLKPTKKTLSIEILLNKKTEASPKNDSERLALKYPRKKTENKKFDLGSPVSETELSDNILNSPGNPTPPIIEIQSDNHNQNINKPINNIETKLDAQLKSNISPDISSLFLDMESNNFNENLTKSLHDTDYRIKPNLNTNLSSTYASNNIQLDNHHQNCIKPFPVNNIDPRMDSHLNTSSTYVDNIMQPTNHNQDYNKPSFPIDNINSTMEVNFKSNLSPNISSTYMDNIRSDNYNQNCSKVFPVNNIDPRMQTQLTSNINSNISVYGDISPKVNVDPRIKSPTYTPLPTNSCFPKTKPDFQPTFSGPTDVNQPISKQITNRNDFHNQTVRIVDPRLRRKSVSYDRSFTEITYKNEKPTSKYNSKEYEQINIGKKSYYEDTNDTDEDKFRFYPKLNDLVERKSYEKSKKCNQNKDHDNYDYGKSSNSNKNNWNNSDKNTSNHYNTNSSSKSSSGNKSHNIHHHSNKLDDLYKKVNDRNDFKKSIKPIESIKFKIPKIKKSDDSNSESESNVKEPQKKKFDKTYENKEKNRLSKTSSTIDSSMKINDSKTKCNVIPDESWSDDENDTSNKIQKPTLTVVKSKDNEKVKDNVKNVEKSKDDEKKKKNDKKVKENVKNVEKLKDDEKKKKNDEKVKEKFDKKASERTKTQCNVIPDESWSDEEILTVIDKSNESIEDKKSNIDKICDKKSQDEVVDVEKPSSETQSNITTEENGKPNDNKTKEESSSGNSKDENIKENNTTEIKVDKSENKTESEKESINSYIFNLFNVDSKCMPKESLLKLLEKFLDEKKFSEVKKVLEKSDDDDDNNEESRKLEIPTETKVDNEVKEDDNVKENNLDEVKSSSPKLKKKQTKKSELQKLNEDIREMFICEGVLTSTGRRMCHILAENKMHESMTSSTRTQEKEKPIPANEKKRKLRNSNKKLQDESINQNESDTDSMSVTTTGSDFSTSKRTSARFSKIEPEPEPLPKKVNKVIVKKIRRKNSSWASGIIRPKKRPPKQQPKQENIPTKTIENKVIINKKITVPKPKIPVKPKRIYNNDPNLKRMGKCLFCDYDGRFLIQHYSIEHQDIENYASHLRKEIADMIKSENHRPRVGTIEQKKVSFNCYFCLKRYVFDVREWITHIAMHTGEVILECNTCDYITTYKNKIKNEHLNCKGKVKDRYSFELEDNKLYGYYCDDCNFIQLRKEVIEKHVKTQHPNKKKKPEIITFCLFNKGSKSTTNVKKAKPKKVDSKPKTKPSNMGAFIPAKDSSDEEIEENKLNKEKQTIMDNLIEPLTKRTTRSSIAEKLNERFKSPIEKQIPIGKSKNSSKTDEQRSTQIDSSDSDVTATVIVDTESEQSTPVSIVKSIRNEWNVENETETEDTVSGDDNTNDDNDEWEDIESDNEEDDKKPDIALIQETVKKAKKGYFMNTLRRLYESINPDATINDKKSEKRKSPIDIELNDKKSKKQRIDFRDILREQQKDLNKSKDDDIIDLTEPDEIKIKKEIDETNSSTGNEISTFYRVQRIGCHKKILNDSTTYVYECLFDNCSFKTLFKNDFILHLATKKKNELWEGYCCTCGYHVKLEENLSISNELQHLLDFHIKLPEKIKEEITKPKTNDDEMFYRVDRIGCYKKGKSYAPIYEFQCLFDGCKFKTINKNEFILHLSTKNDDEVWDGYCYKCESHVKFEENLHISVELQHLLDFHVKLIDPIVIDCEKKTIEKPLLALRKLPGDTLSSSHTTNIEKSLETSKPVIKIINGKTINIKTPVRVIDPKVIKAVKEISSVANLPTIHSDVNKSLMVISTPTTIKPSSTLTSPSSSISTNIVMTQTNEVNDYNEIINRLKPWTKLDLFKSHEICEIMLDINNLFVTYKCMAINCSFTSYNNLIFLNHIRDHEKYAEDQLVNNPVDLDTTSWLECSYCKIFADTCSDLEAHVKSEHSPCNFQCSHCFYRSMCCTANIIHQNIYHPDLEVNVLAINQLNRCITNIQEYIDLRNKNIRPIYCNETDCTGQFYAMDVFHKHILSHSTDVFKCKLCSLRVPKIKAIQHLSTHGIGLYECIYCNFGTNKFESLKLHLCNDHMTKELFFVIRLERKSNQSLIILSSNLYFKTLDSIYFIHLDEKIDSSKLRAKVPVQINLSEALNRSKISSKPGFDFDCLFSWNECKDIIMKQQQVLDNVLDIIDESELTDKSNKIEVTSDQGTLFTINMPEKEQRIVKPVIDQSLIKGRLELQQDIDDVANKLLNEMINKSSYACLIDNCYKVSKNLFILNNHLLVHGDRATKKLKCFACSKTYPNMLSLTSHLKTHRFRFFCYYCNYKSHVANLTLNHVNTAHKILSKTMLQLNPTKPLTESSPMVVGDDKLTPEDVFQFGLKLIENNKIEQNKYKRVFDPSEAYFLPRLAIFPHEISCSECNYSTKVCKNMYRHLLFHRNEIPVPKVDPVNPVPCLNTNEKHFDKMLNLACSSQADRDKIVKFNDAPKYIAMELRFVCGAKDCRYLTQFEDNFRCHLTTLHKDETYFKCFHCSFEEQEHRICVDKIVQHLRLHGMKLYKCIKCDYYHYQKYIVERHQKDVHQLQHESVYTIREDVLNSKSTNPEENIKWECQICNFISDTKKQISDHCLDEHKVKLQYYCNICLYRSNTRLHLLDHVTQLHNGGEDYIKAIYDKTTKTDSTTHVDNSPLWRRDENKIKHIRGILFEEENESASFLNDLKDESNSNSSNLEEPKLTKNLTTTTTTTKKQKYNIDSMFRCSYCPKRTTNYNVMLAHWKKTHRTVKLDVNQLTYRRFSFRVTKLARCFYCYTVVNFIDMHHHISKRHENKTFAAVNINDTHVCAECDYRLTERNRFIQHYESTHLTKDGIKCYPDDLKRPESLMEIINKYPALYSCMFCEMESDLLLELEQHHATYHTDKGEPNIQRKTDRFLYGCSFVPCKKYIFSDEVTITKHMQRHFEYSRQNSSLKSLHDYESFGNMKVLFPNGFMATKNDLQNTEYGSMENIKETLQKDEKWNKAWKRIKLKRKSSDGNIEPIAKIIKTYSPKKINEKIEEKPESNETIEIDDDQDVEFFSYYKEPKESIDLETVYTKMNIGGENVKISCANFAKVVDINPKLIIEKINVELY